MSGGIAQVLYIMNDLVVAVGIKGDNGECSKSTSTYNFESSN
jgi:hypothetical protein